MTSDNAETPLWKDPNLREKGWRHLEQKPVQLGEAERGQADPVLVEDLRLHKAELEVQNEELQATTRDLERLRDWYRDLFEHAPVGYLIISAQGWIQAANLRAEDLLGTPRGQLIGAAMADHVAPAAQDAWFRFRRSLAPSMGRLVEEVDLRTSGAGRTVRVEAVPAPERASEEPAFRCALADITQQRRAERALQRERDLLEQRVTERTEALKEAWGYQGRLLESLGEGVFGVDREGRFTFVNPAALNLLGYDSADQLLGRPAPALIRSPTDGGPPDGEGPCPILKVIRSEKPVMGCETRFRRAEGADFPVEVHASPVFAASDDVEGAVVAFSDIQERKVREEQAHRDGEAVRRALADNAIGHWRWDPDDGGLYASSELFRLLGLDPETTPATWRSLLRPVRAEDRRALHREVEAALAGEADEVGVDLHIGHPGGGPRVVRVQGTVVRSTDGQAPHLVGVAQDVTANVTAASLPRIDVDSLTAREHEVLRCLSQGLTNKEVARRMGVSPRTVEEHRARIMDKLGVRSFAELIPLPDD